MLLGADGAAFLRNQGVAFLAIDATGLFDSNERLPFTSALAAHPAFVCTP